MPDQLSNAHTGFLYNKDTRAVAVVDAMCVYEAGKMSNCSKLGGLQSAVTMIPLMLASSLSWDTSVGLISSKRT